MSLDVVLSFLLLLFFDGESCDFFLKEMMENDWCYYSNCLFHFFFGIVVFFEEEKQRKGKVVFGRSCLCTRKPVI